MCSFTFLAFQRSQVSDLTFCFANARMSSWSAHVADAAHSYRAIIDRARNLGRRKRTFSIIRHARRVAQCQFASIPDACAPLVSDAAHTTSFSRASPFSFVSHRPARGAACQAMHIHSDVRTAGCAWSREVKIKQSSCVR